MTSERLGILGGTFDPIHLGHIASATEIAEAFSLTKVFLVLSARPPHKRGSAEASVEHRLEMLRLATSGNPRLLASDIEARRAGPSYMVETLGAFRGKHTAAELFLVVGIDAWKDVDSWHEPESLLELAHVIVTSRPGAEFAPGRVEPPIAARGRCCYDSNIGAWVHTSGHRLVARRIKGVTVSSTDIRHRVRQGLPIEHMVPALVADYIRNNGLYA